MTNTEECDELRYCLKNLIDCLDSKEMQGVWGYLYVHGYKYTGPVADMNRARAALMRPLETTGRF